MKKIIILSLATVTCLLTLSVTTSSQAASWHKGTPKVLRGGYAYDKARNAYGTVGVLLIKKNSCLVGEPKPLGSSIDIKNVRYKKIGKYYRLKGKVKLTKWIIDETHIVDQVFYKKDKKLKNVRYKTFKKSHFSHYKGLTGIKI